MVYGNVENYLEGCTVQHVIPGYASLDEMAFHVLESVESDYNAMMMSVGVMELAHLEENGSEMVYEAEGGKVKQIVDKAVEMFKSMWSKVQGLIQTALEAFEKKAQEFREKVMKKLDSKVLDARVKGLKADRNFGTTYEYKNINEYSSSVIAKIQGSDKKVEDLYTSAASASKNSNNELLNGLGDKLDAEVKSVIQSLCPNAQNASSIVKMMKDDIRGSRKDVNGDWVKSNYKTIIDEVRDYPVTKKTLKSNYKALQKTYNEAIKKCKKANTDKFFEANAYTKAIKAYKDLRQVTIYCQQAVISCLNERQGFYRSVIFKLIGSKPVKEAAVSESATMDKVDSLFNW